MSEDSLKGIPYANKIQGIKKLSEALLHDLVDKTYSNLVNRGDISIDDAIEKAVTEAQSDELSDGVGDHNRQRRWRRALMKFTEDADIYAHVINLTTVILTNISKTSTAPKKEEKQEEKK